jgi:uncharacterized protein YqeY
MSLIDKVKADQLAARKARDTVAASLLTTLLGEVTTLAKNAGREHPTDEEVSATIRKFLKSNTELQSHLIDVALLATAKLEAMLLTAFLPKQMSEDELRVAVKAIVADGAANVGAVMGQLKAKHAGLYDGKTASAIIKEVLG